MNYEGYLGFIIYDYSLVLILIHNFDVSEDSANLAQGPTAAKVLCDRRGLHNAKHLLTLLEQVATSCLPDAKFAIVFCVKVRSR